MFKRKLGPSKYSVWSYFRITGGWALRGFAVVCTVCAYLHLYIAFMHAPTISVCDTQSMHILTSVYSAHSCTLPYTYCICTLCAYQHLHTVYVCALTCVRISAYSTCILCTYVDAYTYVHIDSSTYVCTDPCLYIQKSLLTKLPLYNQASIVNLAVRRCNVQISYSLIQRNLANLTPV